MTISDRYRQLVAEVQNCLTILDQEPEPTDQEARIIAQALDQLNELIDQVGDIPRIRLESQLTPILLKAHNQLDRARLLLEERDLDAPSDVVWELQQSIYRLLNDL